MTQELQIRSNAKHSLWCECPQCEDEWNELLIAEDSDRVGGGLRKNTMKNMSGRLKTRLYNP